MNPFLEDDYHFKWSNLKPEYIEPDIREALRRARVNIDEFKKISIDEFSYVNVLNRFESATRELSRAWGLVSHLDSVLNSPEQRKAYNSMMPEVTAFFTSLTLDSEIWAIIKAYSISGCAKSLSGVNRRFLDETLADFKESGAELAITSKETLAKINAELALKTQKYSENVLDSTNAWEIYIEDEKRLEGLPISAVAAAKQSAEAKGRLKAWRFTLQAPSVMPVLQYANDECFRRECWLGLCQVGYNDKFDNTFLVGEILHLRQQKANLLGKKHFADLTTSRRMAKTGDNALKFIEDMGKRIRAKFQNEVEELEKFRASKTGDELRSLHPWEFAYWSEKMRRDKFDFDEEALRPWFPIEGVISGMFELFGRLFGVQFVARDVYHVDCLTGEKTVFRVDESRSEEEPVCVWHPEVRFYEVRDGERLMGSFYTDWFPRETKRGGAWMNFFRTGGPRSDGSFLPHLGLMCGNFTPPVSDKQALLNHDEVTTLFHEFGHLLHQLLSEVEVESLSGVRVAWDFVELPSQILENWCWEEEALALFARHYQTGSKVPSDMLVKLAAASNFRSASDCMRQLALSKLDLDLHMVPQEIQIKDLDSQWNEDYAEWQARSTCRGPSVARRFSHIFSDATGYAAGYYSYKWAEALEADAFTRFVKEGILNPEVGHEFRIKILAKGNSETAEKLFYDFMGRELDSEAMLLRDGLV